MLVPDADQPVACGAAVQAAAVLSGSSFDHVSGAWGLGHAVTIDPDPAVDGGAIRAAYASALTPLGCLCPVKQPPVVPLDPERSLW